MFTKTACGSDCYSREHSLPLPVYPSLQTHVYLPGKLLHVACGSHSNVPSVHSSISKQTTKQYSVPPLNVMSWRTTSFLKYAYS